MENLNSWNYKLDYVPANLATTKDESFKILMNSQFELSCFVAAWKLFCFICIYIVFSINLFGSINLYGRFQTTLCEDFV